MSYRPTFAIDSIGEDDPIAVELALKAMGHLLLALVAIDEDYLRTLPSQFPADLYESGIRYDRMEPPPGSACGDDDWQDIAHVYALRLGDCEDLACARVAELRVKYGLSGDPSSPFYVSPMVMLQRGGAGTDSDPRHLYHVMVRWPERLPPGYRYPPTVVRHAGMWVECPSSVLGMPGGDQWLSEAA